MRFTKLANELQKPRDDPASIYGKAEYLANLTQDDAQSDPVQEANQDRLRQKICHDPESQETRADAHEACKET